MLRLWQYPGSQPLQHRLAMGTVQASYSVQEACWDGANDN